ncbi:MAG: NAD(P)/FAD-dependent oxidoreductase, partial [Wenzhouxiangellaceae bacterium]
MNGKAAPRERHSMDNSKSGKRVVIVGGGIAGLELATALGRKWSGRRDAPSVMLIDRDSAHVWKPMLHTIAAGTRDIFQQQTPYLAQAHDAGFEYQPGEMCGLEREAREIELAPLLGPDGRLLVPARKISYDCLIMAVGSEANDFGTSGVAEHCFRIDSRLQADAFNREVRIRILQCLAQDQKLSIAIVGGGATGVELAAELVRLTETAVTYGAKTLASRISVTLIESGDRLLAAFPQNISDTTRETLENLGVNVVTGARVTGAVQEGLTLADGARIDATLMVWAAGVKGPAFLSELSGLECTRNNQLVVQSSLQTRQDSAIFAIGDCASLTLPDAERPLPPTAQVAHQQAQHLIGNLPGFLLEGRPIPDFRYHDFGSLVSLADYDAYGSLGKLGLLKGGTIRGR